MKKKLSYYLAIVLMMGWATANSFAQSAPAGNNPAQQGQVKTIFSFKDEIGLSDDQEDKLKALLYDEQSLLDTNNNTLKGLGGELSKLIESKADMGAIRSKLEEISKIQVDVSCRNIEDSRKIETILTPDQIEKWKAIQKKFAPQGQ